jgi:hypothetical protein
MFEANWLKTISLQGIEVFISQVIHVHVPQYLKSQLPCVSQMHHVTKTPNME